MSVPHSTIFPVSVLFPLNQLQFSLIIWVVKWSFIGEYIPEGGMWLAYLHSISMVPSVVLNTQKKHLPSKWWIHMYSKSQPLGSVCWIGISLLHISRECARKDWHCSLRCTEHLALSNEPCALVSSSVFEVRAGVHWECCICQFHFASSALISDTSSMPFI